MATLTWVEGLEHGVLSTSGAGLFDTITNAPTIDSTIKRTGSYSLRFYKTSAAACFADKNVSGSPTYLVGRFYVYFTTLPSAGTTICRGYTAGSVSFYITYNPTGTKLEAYCATGGTQAGPTVTTGVWYRIEFRFYCGGTTYTIDWQTATGDGSPTVHTQATATGQTASTFSTFTLGSRVSCTLDMYEDDVVLSTTTGDYPIGAGGIVGLSPNADGSHNNSGDYLDNAAGSTIDGSTVYAYAELDELPISESTTYVKATGVDVDPGTDYVEVNFADTSQTTIHGAMCFLAYKSPAATSNDGACSVWGGLNEAVVYDGDMSETSNFYKSVIVPTPSGGWSQSGVNAIYARLGFSTDASPNPYWLNLLVQVAYAASTGYSLSCEGGSYALTGTAATPKRDGKIVPEAGSYALSGQAAGAYYGRAIDADAGAYDVTGTAAAVLRAAKIAPEAGAYAVDGQAASILRGMKIVPESGAYVLTGTEAAALYGRAIDADAGSYVLTGQDAALLRAARLVLDAGAYVLAGQQVTLTYTPGGGAYLLSCEGGTYAIVGADIGALKGSKIPADSGAYTVTGQAAATLLNRLVSAGAGAYAIAGFDVTLLRDARLDAESGSIVVAGTNATLIYSGQSGGVLKIWNGSSWVRIL